MSQAATFMQEAWSSFRDDNPAVPSAITLFSTADLPDELTKQYVLREMGLWRARSARHQELSSRYFIGYDVATAVDCSLVRQRGALRAGLMVASVLGRTLVLPPFWSQAGEGRRQVGCASFPSCAII